MAVAAKHIEGCACERCRAEERAQNRQQSKSISVSNTRVDEMGAGLARHCGRFSLRGSALDRSHILYRRLNCKCWNCLHCAPRKAIRYKHAIARAAETHDLTRFVTLTLDPSNVGPDAVKHLRESFNELRVYMRRKFGQMPKYVCVLEFQQNGMPHLHLIIGRYVEWQWLKDTWSAVGGGTHVDIRKVDCHRVKHYLTKYLTKELLMSAPKKSRRVTCSRGISLNDKPPRTHAWAVLERSIYTLLSEFNSVAAAVSYTAEQLLESFTVPWGESRSLVQA